ncbi:hypothetical protein PRIPAC_82218 [Pristionchus pacificus]|uniref:ShK domain-containing protein n=1 Tax=Pristionchus pacificus TaxID=54126 RepID=A0A2A6C346_PRIPA|nr:hypothetical protein PRIPAC_82218 [Pristionchus pacificus]|eukprot:PDM72539.1 ShK domain-containing protein [Pristionchus pacificus]
MGLLYDLHSILRLEACTFPLSFARLSKEKEEDGLDTAGERKSVKKCDRSHYGSCANWARNGFCTNAAYSKSMIQLLCPTIQILPSNLSQFGMRRNDCQEFGRECEVSNHFQYRNCLHSFSCGKWANEQTAVFCASPVITTSMVSIFGLLGNYLHILAEVFLLPDYVCFGNCEKIRFSIVPDSEI